MDIGQRLREARKAEGLTQEGLARRASVSLNGVRQIETGERTDPHVSTVTKLAFALNVPLSDLVVVDAPLPEPDPERMSVEELARFSNRVVEAAQVAVEKTGAKSKGSLELAEKLDNLSDALPGFLKLSLALTPAEEKPAPKWLEVLEVSPFELKAVADKAYQQAVEESIDKDDATLMNIHECREKLGAEINQFSKQRAG